MIVRTKDYPLLEWTMIHISKRAISLFSALSEMNIQSLHNQCDYDAFTIVEMHSKFISSSEFYSEFRSADLTDN